MEDCDEECIVCAYPFDTHERLPALVSCGHNSLCSMCYLRIRALQRNFCCPSCKRELEHVICTDKPGMKYEDFQVWGESIGPDFNYDQKSRMFFPSKYYRAKAQKLWSFRCSVCSNVSRDMKALRAHVQAEHGMQMCLQCIEHKQVFPSEQKTYSQKGYEDHLRKGDNDGSQGHPSCEFCRKRFYDSTALFVHLNKEHYTCHICERNGLKFKYFKDYPNLEGHFRARHRLCEEAGCMAKKFVVFENDIDLEVHNRQWHPSFLMRKTSNIQLDFKVARQGAPVGLPGTSSSSTSMGANMDVRVGGGDPAQDGAGAVREEECAGTGAGGEARSAGRYEGGLGGRAVNGEWQVELAPTSSDPRDINRNAHITLSEGRYASASGTGSGSGSGSGAAFGGGGGSGESMPSSSALAEDFPLLGAAGLGGISITNRWVSIGGGGGGNGGGGGARKGLRKQDFPELKSSGISRGNSQGGTASSKISLSKPSSGGVGVGVGLGARSGMVKAKTGGSLAAWAMVQPSKGGKGAGAGGKRDERAEFDEAMAMAMAASLKTEGQQAQQEFEAEEPPAPPPVYSASQQNYPALGRGASAPIAYTAYSTSTSAPPVSGQKASAAQLTEADFPAPPAPPAGRVKGAGTGAGLGSGKSKAGKVGGWGEALSSVGIGQAKKSTLSKPKLSVVKSTASAPVPAATLGDWDNLKPIGKRVNDEEFSYGAPMGKSDTGGGAGAYSAPGVGLKKYGWAAMGGSGAKQSKASSSVPSAPPSKDYPALGSK